MPYQQRQTILQAIETHTKRPLIAFLTNQRPGAQGQISSDACRQFIDQLSVLPTGANKLDLLISSYGGDGLASWRIISMIREKLGSKGHLRALVPNNAFSAATLLALGCDEILMHPVACLGPVDPQITVARPGHLQQKFAYEDLLAFGDFLRDEMKIQDEKSRATLFEHLAKEIQPTVIGFGKRSSSQAERMAVRLLKMHMNNEAKVKSIAGALNKSFHNHGHAVSRTEAKEIGLKIANPDLALEEMIWNLYADYETELEMNKAFDPLQLVLNDPAAAPMLQPPNFVAMPANAPPPVQAQVWQNVLNNIAVNPGVSVEFKLIQAVVESLRIRSRYRSIGKALGSRKFDLEYIVSIAMLEAGWEPY